MNRVLKMFPYFRQRETEENVTKIRLDKALHRIKSAVDEIRSDDDAPAALTILASSIEQTEIQGEAAMIASEEIGHGKAEH